MRVAGKVVLITGASEGIGAACAAEFARAGARVSLTARSEERLREVAPSGACITAGDITSQDVREQVVARTVEQFGLIDILINNAGVGAYGPSWEAPLEETRRIMEVNFFAPLALAALVAPGMKQRSSGLIVNVGSIGGKVTLPWMTLYSASKWAVGGWTAGLRMELRGYGIRTMLVCPGYVKTSFQKNVLAGAAPVAVMRARRFAITAEQCAQAILRGVERDARTVLAPRSGWLLVAAAQLFPGIVEARMARMVGVA